MSLLIKSEVLVHFLAGIRAREIGASKYQAACCISVFVYVFVLWIDSEEVQLAVRFARTKRGRNDLTKYDSRNWYCKEHLGT